MKEFSTHWKSSKKPKKQRKYRAKAPMHIKRKFLSTTLSKELRAKYKIRNIIVRKGDTIKVMKGKFNGKTGKVSEVKTNLMKIYVEGIQKKKQDGSMVNIPFRAPNLQIMDLNTDDKKRFKKLKTESQKKNEAKNEKGEEKKK